jgi:zinc D-Ala-D-Ala carboxypeptidase
MTCRNGANMGLMITSNFTREELECPCCRCLGLIEENLLPRLQAARTIYGKPITVTSGYRCEKHNAEIGGATNSLHPLSSAIDAKYISGTELGGLVKAFIAAGFNEIGIYEKHIHAGYNPYQGPLKVFWGATRS